MTPQNHPLDSRKTHNIVDRDKGFQRPQLFPEAQGLLDAAELGERQAIKVQSVRIAGIERQRLAK